MPESLPEWIRGVPNFDSWTHTQRIRLFGWFIHVHLGRDRFSTGDIRNCYTQLHAETPGNISQLLANLANQNPREVLKDGRGHYLERKLREALDAKYGQRASTVQVIQALTELPSKLPDSAERAYLEEALICFRHGAFRAAAIMTWNVAYDHLCSHILTKRLTDFNAQWTAPSTKIKSIAAREDFHGPKERDVLQACRAANITSKNVHAVLDEKLNVRNRIAHAGGQSFLQPQAEAYILDLINNAVLVL